MTALEHILEGLEAELALERELGVRLVECDRSLLASGADAPAPAAPPRQEVRPSPASLAPQPARPPVRTSGGGILDFVFLHDRPLTSAGNDMMEKIAAALGRTLETAPVVCEGPAPQAKAYIVLGGLALKKWLPGVNASPGQWVSTQLSPNVLVTYSPAYILRFSTVTPAVQKIKKEMWASLKSVLQRVRGS